jgi:hypothetical protein
MHVEQYMTAAHNMHVGIAAIMSIQFHPYLHELMGLILEVGEFLVSTICMLCQYLHHMSAMTHTLSVIFSFFLSAHTGINNEFKTINHVA